MAKEMHDVVVIGGGHNGLVVAAYLAKAGLDVCVLEKQDNVGGGVITRELTLPGFKHDPGSVMHGTIQANPLIHRDELDLKAKYGLKYIYPDKQLTVIFPDNRSLVFYRDIDKTCESISQFSQRDAEAYRRFYEATRQMLKIASVATFSPPPSWGAMMSVLDASDEGREFVRTIMSSAMDIVGEWFETEQVKVALTRFASDVLVGPWEKGTGNTMFFVSLMHSWGLGLPVGGSGALSDALAAFIVDNGGTIKVSNAVTSIKVEDNEAKGVVTESGEEIMATRAMVSSVNVKQLFLDMLTDEELPSRFRDKVKQLKPASFSALHQAFALNEAPHYKAGEEVAESFFVEMAPSSVEELSRIFEEYRYGIINSTIPLVVTATLVDSTRAPNGKHTLYLYHYEPYSLKDGGPSNWNERKQEVADNILETLRQHTTNMGPENILGRWIMSPLDLEQYFPSMQAGDMGHIGQFMTQFFAYRPLPGWGHYRTPLNKLYMCGASTHPGLGVVGGGRATVQVIMEDLGIDFKKVIAR